MLITLICLNDVTTALTLDSPLRLYKMTSAAAPLAHPAAMILRGEERPVFIQQLNKIETLEQEPDPSLLHTYCLC